MLLNDVEELGSGATVISSYWDKGVFGPIISDGGVGKTITEMTSNHASIFSGWSTNYAYVADGWSGFRIINISNPASPTEVGYHDTPGYANGVYVSGNYAYVANMSGTSGTPGLSIIKFVP